MIGVWAQAPQAGAGWPAAYVSAFGDKAWRCAGQVVNAAGEPKPQATVSVDFVDLSKVPPAPNGAAPPTSLVLPAGTTDATGHFDLGALPPGAKARLIVEAPGCAQLGARIYAVTGAPPLRLVVVPEAVISGIVTRDGQPVPGVAVLAWPDSGGFLTLAHQATTGADGKYKVGALSTGTYHVVPTCPPEDGVARWRLRVATKSGEQTTDQDFSLTTSTVVTGTVTRADPPEPMKGVTVYAEDPQAGLTLSSAVTDAAGKYLLHVPPGDLRVHSSFDGVGKLLTLQEGETRPGQDFVVGRRLPAGGAATVSGHLTHNGQPVPGVVILALTEGYTGQDTTVADGSWTITGLPVGSYTFRLDHLPEGLLAGPLPALTVQAGAQPASQALTVITGGSISGRVTIEGKPVAGVALDTHVTDSNGGWVFTRTEGDGTYLLPGLATGTYTILVHDTPQGYAPVTRSGVAVKVGELLGGQDFALTPGAGSAGGGSLFGKVTLDGKPLVGITVTARSAGVPDAHAVTDADGDYTFTGLGTAAYSLIVLNPPDGYAPVSRYPVTVKVGGLFGTPDLVLTPGALVSGTVTRGDTRQPLAGVEVAGIGLGGIYVPVKTDAAGKYAFRLSPGFAEIRITYPDQPGLRATPTEQQLTLKEGETREGVDFVFQPPSSLRGQVLSPDGTPAVGVQVITAAIPWYAAREDQSNFPSATTDAAGNFSLRITRDFRTVDGRTGTPGKATALWVMALDAQRDLAGVAAAHAPDDTLTIQLASAAHLTAEVVDAQRQPVPGIPIGLSLGVGTNVQAYPGNWRTDARGHVRLGPLPAGAQLWTYLDVDEQTGVQRLTLDNAWLNLGAKLAAGEERHLPVLRIAPHGLSVQGTVVGADDQPVPGARVYGKGLAQPVVTDAQGKFSLTGLAVTEAGVVAVHPTRLLFAAAEVRADQKGDLRLVLAKTVSLRGQLLDAQGQPVAGARVRAEWHCQGGWMPPQLFAAGWMGWVITDAQGHWRHQGLLPGLPYDLRVWVQDPKVTAQWTLPPLTLQPGEDRDLGPLQPPKPPPPPPPLPGAAGPAPAG